MSKASAALADLARARRSPATGSRRRAAASALEVGEERGRERVEADQRVVVERERVGLDRAGLRVDAGDRLRVDRRCRGRSSSTLRPGDDRVGERLQRARRRRRIGGERGGGCASGDRQRAARPARPCRAAGDVPARELELEVLPCVSTERGVRSTLGRMRQGAPLGIAVRSRCVLAVPGAAADTRPPSAWDGVEPVRAASCSTRASAPTVPHPDADPFCVEFDKRRQNVTELGVVDFLSKEPARVAAGGRQVLLLPVRPLARLGRPGRRLDEDLRVGRPLLLRQGARRRRRVGDELQRQRPDRRPVRDPGLAAGVGPVLRAGHRRRDHPRRRPGRPALRRAGSGGVYAHAGRRRPGSAAADAALRRRAAVPVTHRSIGPLALGHDRGARARAPRRPPRASGQRASRAGARCGATVLAGGRIARPAHRPRRSTRLHGVHRRAAACAGGSGDAPHRPQPALVGGARAPRTLARVRTGVLIPVRGFPRVPDRDARRGPRAGARRRSSWSTTARSSRSAATRVRVVRRDAPGGPAAARATGLDALGDVDVVALCDADDAWEPGSLAALVAGAGARAARGGGVRPCAGRRRRRPPDRRALAGARRGPARAGRVLRAQPDPDLVQRAAPHARSRRPAASARRTSSPRTGTCGCACAARCCACPGARVRYRRHPDGLTADVERLARAQLALHERHADLVDDGEAARRAQARPRARCAARRAAPRRTAAS